MFDVGDLPVLTFGNWVLKAEWLNCLWLTGHVRFFTFFYVFFQNPKIHDFLRFFELLHTFSRTVHDDMYHRIFAKQDCVSEYIFLPALQHNQDFIAINTQYVSDMFNINK